MTVALAIVVLACLAALWRGRIRLRALGRDLDAFRASARVDPASTLRNSIAFGEDLEIELERSARTGCAACLIVFSAEPLSDDESKLPAWKLTDAVSTAMRAVDVPYRIGPGEFAVVLPDTRAEGALLAAHRLAHELLRRDPVPARLRAGLAELGPGIDRHELVRHAYGAFLAACRNGRPDVVAYGPEVHPGAQGDGGARDTIEA